MPPKKALGKKPVVVQPPVNVKINDPTTESVSSKAKQSKPTKKSGAGVQVDVKKDPQPNPEQIRKMEEEKRKKEHQVKIAKLLQGLNEQATVLDQTTLKEVGSVLNETENFSKQMIRRGKLKLQTKQEGKQR